MAWNALGVLTPTLSWQLYDIPVIGTETFRVKSTWNIPPFWKMRGYLGQFFSTTTEVVGVKRIYPIKDTDQIIELPIPEEFKANNQITRYIGIQLGRTSRVGVSAYDWQVLLDEFMPDPTAGSNTSSQPSSSATTIHSAFPGATPGFY